MTEALYSVVRKYPDGNWHFEGKDLTLRKAVNLKDRLLKEIIQVSPDDIRIIRGVNIFDWLTQAVEETAREQAPSTTPKPLYPHVPKRKEPLYPHRAKSRSEEEDELLDVFQTGRELSKLVPGLKVELMVIPVPKFTITAGEIDDKKKLITINLWEGATRKDALAILAHEYGHIKPGTTEIEIGLGEEDAWRRGFEYAMEWGTADTYIKYASELADFYEQIGRYPGIARGIRRWLGTCDNVEVYTSSEIPQRELTFNGVKHELVGSFKTKKEVDDEANYWRKRRYRARVITSIGDRPYRLYVSISRRQS